MDLQIRKKQLEDELATINRRLRLERVAKRPILTYNRMVLKEDTLFWAVGYRNDIYGQGEWAVRFTPGKRRAEEELEAIALRQEEQLNPKGKIWELRLAK